MNRTKWTWRPDASGDFDQGKVDGILNTLCSLYAFDVADPDSAEAQGLADPQRVIQIFFETGDPVTVLFGNDTENEKQTYFQVGRDGKSAIIYKSTVDRVFVSREDLKPQA